MYVLELAGTDDEFAAYEASTAASDVSVLAPGLATARGITDRIGALAYTHRVSRLLGTCESTIEDARALVEATSLDRSGSVAVRSEDVRGTTGVDTQAVARALGDVLVDRGFTVDLEAPDHELRALFAGEHCAIGWLEREPDRTFSTRQPGDRPFFQPGSMDPKLARALVNIAGARPGRSVFDPMCGTGGILIEAGLVGASVIGMDVQKKMVRGTRENLASVLESSPDRERAVIRGSADQIPLVDDAVDAVVFDAPYGRQSKIRGDLDQLMADTLTEAARLAPRCVVVGDRPWTQPATAAGMQIEAVFDRRVHRSLTRYIVVARRG